MRRWAITVKGLEAAGLGAESAWMLHEQIRALRRFGDSSAWPHSVVAAFALRSMVTQALPFQDGATFRDVRS